MRSEDLSVRYAEQTRSRAWGVGVVVWLHTGVLFVVSTEESYMFLVYAAHTATAAFSP